MTLWKKKLSAWLHDPAEKALVLMRDVDNQGQRIGHEEGSIAQLRRVLGIARSDFDKRADHYAAAADRPQWPCEDGRPRPAWANVRFVDRPVLIHPLSGEAIDLGKLDDIAAPHIRHASFDHFLDLVETDALGKLDYFRTLLAFWRFGPELAADEIKSLWRLLPADTRVPDHSIWSHLDVVSALTGAMENGQPALLSMSFGPVQGFIAQARSTSDLWAGSHLLSSLVWEGLKIICQELGPDAVLFPQLRGVAAVDRWLLETAPTHRRDFWRQRFENANAQWLKSATDANPLFAATLPNKFMAIVPVTCARELAESVKQAVQEKALKWAMDAAQRVFKEAGGDTSDQAHWRTQVAGQLRGFPEVQWSVAEWSTATDENGFPCTETLEAALAAFYPEGDESPGFFHESVWKLAVSGTVEERQGGRRSYKKLVVEGGHEFFVPNPGLLYPAVHDLAERTLAAAKSLRPFDALPQRGYRCTLTGEHEWLTDDPDLFEQGYAEQKNNSVWTKVVGKFGVKEGEHLGALSTLKRLWPTLLIDQVAEFLEDKPSRFVVSTHTMALATSLGELLRDGSTATQEKLSRFSRDQNLSAYEGVTLPKSLHSLARRVGENAVFVAKRIPAWLDAARVAQPDGEEPRTHQLEDLLGHKPETYYAFIQMDGDRMGAWMAGNEPEFQLPFEETWHEQVRASVKQKFGSQPGIADYMRSPRPASPARHAAISSVLNDFSTHVARHVIEEIFKGKLLYAGGDDVLAMVSVDDLLPAMLLLRAAYSGVGDVAGLPDYIDLKGLRIGKGYVWLNGRPMLMMGSRATASMGAVVAHHQAPLGAVLRHLREAEKRAKAHKGADGRDRNAFCLRIMKRGGGEVGITARFWDTADAPTRVASPAGYLLRLADALANTDFSRRAVYKAQVWLADMPPRPPADDAAWREMVASYLAFQFEKQRGFRSLAYEAVALACSDVAPAIPVPDDRIEYREAIALEHLLVVAEFFAREGRVFGKGV